MNNEVRRRGSHLDSAVYKCCYVQDWRTRAVVAASWRWSTTSTSLCTFFKCTCRTPSLRIAHRLPKWAVAKWRMQPSLQSNDASHMKSLQSPESLRSQDYIFCTPRLCHYVWWRVELSSPGGPARVDSSSLNANIFKAHNPKRRGWVLQITYLCLYAPWTYWS